MNPFLEMISLKGEYSSTRFVYFLINIVSVIIVLICGFVMVVETLKPEKTNFDYFSGLAQIILACAGMICFAGATKVFTDKFDAQSESLNHDNEIRNKSVDKEQVQTQNDENFNMDNH